AHFVAFDDWLREAQFLRGAVEAREGAAIQLGEEGLGRWCNDVDELAFERFPFAEGFSIGDRGDGQRYVAPAARCITAQIRGGFVHDFALERVVNFHGAASE